MQPGGGVGWGGCEVGPLGLTCLRASLPETESSSTLSCPRRSARCSSSCSWHRQYCSRAISSFSKVSSCNVPLVCGSYASPHNLGTHQRSPGPLL